MNKILIIGKKSFLGSSLSRYLSKSFKVDNFSYETIRKKKPIFFEKYSHVINTAILPQYVNKKYNENYDLDVKFLKKFRKINFYYVFLNTRKIYSLNTKNTNVSENSKIKPTGTYAQNKLTTEKYLRKNINKKLISLRISNVIGKRLYKNSRNSHKLFFDNFLTYRKNNKKKEKLIIVNNDFKDFLSIDQFCGIVSKIIRLKIYGIYNVSISKKIYISEIVSWIDKNFLRYIVFKNSQKDSFTLSNKKLIRKLKIKITKNQLMNFCKKLV